MKIRRNSLFIIFILIISFTYNVKAENTKVLQYKDSLKIPSYSTGNYNSDLKKGNNKKNKKNNNFKVTKKDLKNEIKQRKKYHKSLLNIYNESFNPQYLELIEQNSTRLTSLRELL